MRVRPRRALVLEPAPGRVEVPAVLAAPDAVDGIGERGGVGLDAQADAELLEEVLDLAAAEVDDRAADADRLVDRVRARLRRVRVRRVEAVVDRPRPGQELVGRGDLAVELEVG